MNPFGDDDEGSNPFFETSKSSDFDSDSVFGKGEPEPPKAASPPPVPAKNPSPPPASQPNPQQSMIDFSSPAPAASGSSNSYGAILTGINDEPAASSISYTNDSQYNAFFGDASEPSTADSSDALQKDNDGDVDFEKKDEPEKKKKGAKKKKVVKKKKVKSAEIVEGDEEEEGEEDKAEEKEEERHCYHMFYKISWYKQFFDLDSADFFKRFLWGLVPRVSFFEKVGKGDFYGPFWITTTLLLFLAIASNFASYIAFHNEGKGDQWNYNFYKLCVGAGVFYGYVIVIPIGFWAVQKFIVGSGITLLKCFCAYGYSFAPYIIITLVCIAPIEWVRWVAISVAAAVSTLTLCAAFVGGFTDNMAKGTPVIIIMALVHVALALVYKLYFFAKVTVPDSDEK